MNRRIALVGGIRIPFCRAGTNYADKNNQDLMTTVLSALVKKYSLEGKTLGDVATGGVMNHSSDWNLSREVVLGSGLAKNTPAVNISRACGTSLEAAIDIGNRIALSQIEVGVAGGYDSMSDVPIAYQPHLSKILVESSKGKSFFDKLKPWFKLKMKDLKPRYPAVTEPRTGKSMGQHCELMAQEWKLTQKEQDELALQSHLNAAAAYKRGFYNDLVIPYSGATQDNNMRADTSLEKLSKLKPSFDRTGKGTLTAGNSSPLTDGAAATLLCSEDYARANNLKIQAYIVDMEVRGVDFVDKKEGLLMAPAYAVPQMLKRQGITLQDFDFYEIHEAFAAQVLCTLKAWESPEFCRDRLGLASPLGSIDRKKLNTVGGSVALGHPFGATGARILATAGKLLEEKGKGRVLISICTGGGMGVTAILERT